MNLSEHIKWNELGLVAAIAQDWQTGDVLMMAWMDEESLKLTLKEQRAVYFSRSRQALWRKGEASGNVQHLKELRVDCDGDTVLLKVDQVGGIACHTGRRSCFYQLADASGALTVTEEVLKDPKEIYGSNT